MVRQAPGGCRSPSLASGDPTADNPGTDVWGGRKEAHDGTPIAKCTEISTLYKGKYDLEMAFSHLEKLREGGA